MPNLLSKGKVPWLDKAQISHWILLGLYWPHKALLRAKAFCCTYYCCTSLMHSFSDGTLERSNEPKLKRSCYLLKMNMAHFWSGTQNREGMTTHYQSETATQWNIIAYGNWMRVVSSLQGEPLSELCKNWSIIIAEMRTASVSTWENHAFR